MIEIRTRRGPLSYRTKWFHPRPRAQDALGPVQYIQSPCLAWRPGFLKESFFTILIDLRLTEDQLFSGCRENTRYEMRRAEREGVACDPAGDSAEFLELNRLLSEAKGLDRIRPEHLEAYGKTLRLT